MQLIRNPVVHVGSKWLKTKALLEDETVSGYVPKTKRMNERTLASMLKEYGMVYVKPVSGTYGMGVMRVEHDRISNRYNYQQGERKREFHTFSGLYKSLLKHKMKRKYLVQQGIHLLKYRKRRFDIRVMVQKNPKGIWESTAVIGRLGHPQKIVTNYHDGGKPMPIPYLLSPHLSPQSLIQFEKILKEVGKQAAIALSRKYPGILMVGADIGVDKKFNPWIIELNTNPDPYIFRHLKQPSVYRKVLRYAKAAGCIPMRKYKNI